MTDRPILFSGPMVNAILEGRKTQTRRVINLEAYADDLKYYACSGKLREYQVGRHGLEFVSKEHGLWHPETNPNGRSAWYVRVPIMTGDRLYVREAWRVGAWHHRTKGIAIDYMADNYARKEWLGHDQDDDKLDKLIDQSRLDAEKAGLLKSGADFEYKWSVGNSPCRTRPSLFMPREFSRLTLVVTDVRVQRLQEISVGDAIAEGIHPSGIGTLHPSKLAVDEFHELWNSINDARGFGWDANPWVVAVTFETHKCNIDQMEANKP